MNRFLYLSTIISCLSQDNVAAIVSEISITILWFGISTWFLVFGFLHSFPVVLSNIQQTNQQQPKLRHGSRRELLSSHLITKVMEAAVVTQENTTTAANTMIDLDDNMMILAGAHSTDHTTDLIINPYDSSDIFVIDPRVNKKFKTGIRSMGTDAASFITFSDKWIDFTGQCDLLLIKFPWNKFELQARTKIIPGHNDETTTQTIVSMIALRIGNDIIEIDDSDITYKNGKLVTKDDFPVPLAGGSLSLTYEVDEDYIAAAADSKQTIAHKHRINLGTSYTKDRDIKISVVDHHIVVQLDGYLANTTGLLGTTASNDLYDRTGKKKIWTTDLIQLCNEWQVNDVDSQLFHDKQLPQYPQKCIFPGDNAYSLIVDAHEDTNDNNNTMIVEEVKDEVIITAHDEVSIHLNETLIVNTTTIDEDVVFVNVTTSHHSDLNLTSIDNNATRVEDVDNEEDKKQENVVLVVAEDTRKPNNNKKNDVIVNDTTTTNTTTTTDHGDDLHVNETLVDDGNKTKIDGNNNKEKESKEDDSIMHSNETSTSANVTHEDSLMNTTITTTEHHDDIEKNETIVDEENSEEEEVEENHDDHGKVTKEKDNHDNHSKETKQNAVKGPKTNVMEEKDDIEVQDKETVDDVDNKKANGNINNKEKVEQPSKLQTKQSNNKKQTT